jgi:hypothetical protein
MTYTNSLKHDILKSVKQFWYGYKVCEGCDVLLSEDVYVCPVCKAYRFDTTKERIISEANKLIDQYIVIE